MYFESLSEDDDPFVSSTDCKLRGKYTGSVIFFLRAVVYNVNRTRVKLKRAMTKSRRTASNEIRFKLKVSTGGRLLNDMRFVAWTLFWHLLHFQQSSTPSTSAARASFRSANKSCFAVLFAFM